MTKYKYSRKDWIAKHFGDYNLMSRYEKELADGLLATVPDHIRDTTKMVSKPTKECELCLEDSGNHTFDCPRHKRNLNPTPPQLPEIEKIQSVETKRLVQGKFVSSFYITEGGGKFLIDKINELTDRLNLLSQRVCKEK